MRLIAITLGLTAIAGAATAETPRQDHGKALFHQSCAQCHNDKGHATRLIKKRIGDGEAELSKRTDLPPEYIKTVVRKGMGSMPWYRRAELSDPDLDAVADYLTRANPPQ